MIFSGFLRYYPTVYCVRNKYQIIFITNEPGIGAVIINGKRYTDNVSGVVRSSSCVHRIEVNMDVLDRALSYTVEFKRVPERTPYHPQTISTETADFSFRSLPMNGDINCYILSDTHGFIDVPVEVGRYFGNKLNLLILGGDMGHNVTDEKEMLATTVIASEICKGEIPVIFMRGNHDTRGAFAEILPDYMGTDNGRTYFPIRVGKLWFVLLDMGEDKPDGHEHYGDTADYTPMREAQTEMLKDIIVNSEREYNSEGVDVRIALSHTPLRFNKVFPELLAQWTEHLNKMGIHIMLAGHSHKVLFTAPENAPDSAKHNFPCVDCSAINKRDISTYKGTALTIKKNEITVSFTNLQHRVIAEYSIPIK